MDLQRALATGRTVRTLGFDDGPFERKRGGPVRVVGVVCADTRLEGLVSGTVRQDGRNATDVLLNLLLPSKFHAQVHAVLLDGLAFGGLNLVDLPLLASVLERPCLAVMRRPPDLPAVLHAVDRLPGALRRRRLLEAAGPIHQSGPFTFQVQGTTPEVAAELLTRVTDRGHVPEPLRLAHLVAGAVATGESGKRA